LYVLVHIIIRACEYDYMCVDNPRVLATVSFVFSRMNMMEQWIMP